MLGPVPTNSGHQFALPKDFEQSRMIMSGDDMSISEDLWNQINKLGKCKDGNYVKDRLKSSLRSLTYDCRDLDLIYFHIGNKLIIILRSLNANFAIFLT
jgi:hypothetical protein